MSKRKYVRQAIIEISDTDDDDEDGKSGTRKKICASSGKIRNSPVIISTNTDSACLSSSLSSRSNDDGEARRSSVKFKNKGKSQEESTSKPNRKRTSKSVNAINKVKKREVKNRCVKRNTKNSEKMGSSSSKPPPTETETPQYRQLSAMVIEETRKLQEEQIQRKILEEHWKKQKEVEEERRLKAQREWQAQQLLNQQVLSDRASARVETRASARVETRDSTREYQRRVETRESTKEYERNSQRASLSEPTQTTASMQALKLSATQKSGTIKKEQPEISMPRAAQQTSSVLNATYVCPPRREQPKVVQRTSVPPANLQSREKSETAEKTTISKLHTNSSNIVRRRANTASKVTYLPEEETSVFNFVGTQSKTLVKSSKSQSSITKPGFNNKSPFPLKKSTENTGIETKSTNNDNSLQTQSTNFVDTDYLKQLIAANSNFTEWSLIDYLQDQHGISKTVANNIITLLDDDNTVPFIARYRRNQTAGMEAEELRRVKDSYERAKVIKRKALVVTKEVDKSGKWTPELHAFIHGTKSLNDLEQIQSMFKVNKTTLAEQARGLGLGPMAEAIFKGEQIQAIGFLVNPQKEGLCNESQIMDGIINILADMINRDPLVFTIIKDIRSQHSMWLESTKTTKTTDSDESKSNKKKEDEHKYDLYHKFSSAEDNLRPHQTLAINRGESRKILSVKVNIPNEFEHSLIATFLQCYNKSIEASAVHKMLMTKAINYAYSKHIKPAIKRRTRQKINELAEIASMEVFAQNVKELLLSPPVRGKVVLGIDPGYRHGCKLAVISAQGEVLETLTLYIHFENCEQFVSDAEKQFVDLVRKHNCRIIALGNGKACRETEVFLSDLIKRKAFAPLDVVYAIVDETGASIYSCSPIAAEEFPSLDVNVISAVSIARRLQDPIAELVKIEPKHLGVGMYQHDLPEKQLAVKLNEVITEAVSFVGVDINTASLSLLTRIAGLTESRAKSIIEWRKTAGPFKSRADLLLVKGIGKRTFEQCAGFVRINPETSCSTSDKKFSGRSFEYLDQTWIHPESYDVARELLKAAKCDIREWGTKLFIFRLTLFITQNLEVLAKKFGTDVETLDLIIKGLMMEKGDDIRTKSDASMFRKNVTSIDDLSVGTKLTGIVRNITHFGAFVDIGVETNGLIHKKFMGNVVLSLNNRVEVTVNSLEKERRRIGLTLIKCL